MSIIPSVSPTPSRTYPLASKSKAVNQASPPPQIHFAGISESQQKTYQQELRRLQDTETPIAHKTIKKQLLMAPLGMFLPASLMPSISRLTHLRQAPQVMEQAFKVQAQFAVTHDLDNLNNYLPYRKRLTEHGNKKALASYDAVLQRVLKQAEFYETDKPADFNKTLHKLWATPQYRQEGKKLEGNSRLKFIWNFFSNRKFRLVMRNDLQQLQKKHQEGLSEEKLSTAFKDLSKLSSRDTATKYLVAGQIADLLYKNPNYLDHVLKNKKGFPLRFVITKDAPTIGVGACVDGVNTIMLNKTFLWFPLGKNTTAQHEFIHASSGHSGMVGDLLPYMSPEQQTKFKAARNWLVEQHETKGSSILGKLRYYLTGKSQTGIRNYAFFNDYEFLTVTLDTFKTNPKGLCQTDAGKTIYEIYKETFGLDPIKELPQ